MNASLKELYAETFTKEASEEEKLATVLENLSDEELQKVADAVGVEGEGEASSEDEVVKQAEEAYMIGKFMAQGFKASMEG